MTTLEIIESTFSALSKRTEAAFDSIEGVNKQHAKTTTGMNNVVDAIREMREKVRNLMSLQDDIAHQFKNVDKIVMGSDASSYVPEPVKRPKKEREPEPEDDYSYTPKSKTSVKFDELSDDEDVKAPEEEPIVESTPAAEEDGDADRIAALEEAERLEKEFEADEAALAEAEEEPVVDEEEEARKIAEIELQRLEEEEARLAEEELKRLEEEEKLRQEEEELRRLEEEEKRLQEEEELRRLQEEEEALRAEEEELRRIEAEEAELKRIEEEEAALKAAEEEEAKKKAEEEAKKKAPPGKGKGKFQFGNQLKGGAGGKNKVVFK